MKLLVMVLNKEEYLKEILSIFAELGISGATLIDTQGMTHALAYDVPIFAGLQKIVGAEKAHNKTIFALVDDDHIVDDLHQILKEEEINFHDPEVGIIFTTPVDKVIQ